MSAQSSASIRASLDHPVIDVDGHTVEFMPALLPYLKQEGVDGASPSFRRRETGTLGPIVDWHALSAEDRACQRVARGPWSGMPSAKTIDNATAILPRLLYDRLDEFGIDLSVLYPSFGLLFLHFDDQGDRLGACRALNRLNADLYAEYADRLVPVGLIPMHTPDEAIDALEQTASLGFKAVVMPGFVQRPVPVVAATHPEAAPWALWLDTYGLDSAYDYDPVWATCARLGLNPSFHSAGLGWQNRRSISSYVYNHVGMLGEAHHALAKSLFLGGVTRRFPELRFNFLEGGVAWGASLYADLIGHWEKRNVAHLSRTDPAKMDWAAYAEFFERYGGVWAADTPGPREYLPTDAAMLDEFAACGIERAEDIRDLFVPQFFFGCEADDPMTATAFNTRVNPFGARLGAMFGSDIAHWDVPDMAEVLEESWEMVERGLLSEADYRDFVFANPVRFYTGTNSAFFAGTVVDAAVGAEVAARA